MSYWIQKIKSSYSLQRRTRRLSPSMHKQFRQEWEANLSRALEEVNRLKAEGWLVDERSPMTAKQAAKILKDGGKMYEHRKVPITRWGEEEIVYLLYKPKPGVVGEGGEEKQGKQIFESKFRRAFQGIEEQDGILIESKRQVGLIRAGQLDSVSEKAREAVRKALDEGESEEVEVNEYFIKALKELEKEGIEAIIIARAFIPIESFIKACRVIKGNAVRIFTHPDAPFVIPLPDGSILMANKAIKPEKTYILSAVKARANILKTQEEVKK